MRFSKRRFRDGVDIRPLWRTWFLNVVQWVFMVGCSGVLLNFVTAKDTSRPLSLDVAAIHALSSLREAEGAIAKELVGTQAKLAELDISVKALASGTAPKKVLRDKRGQRTTKGSE